MPDRVGVDLPAIPLRSDEILVMCCAEVDDATLLRLELVHLKIEMVLLWVFVTRPRRTAIAVYPLKSQLDLAEGYAGPFVATSVDNLTVYYLGIERC